MKMKKNNLKVLFITIYSIHMLEQYEELGVCSIAAYARKNGYEVKMLSYKQDNINYKEILAYNGASLVCQFIVFLKRLFMMLVKD